MESHLLILAHIVTGLTISGVFAVSRSAMSGVVKDASEIRWAHAVNSKNALEKALASSVDFLEADISLGHVKGFESNPAIPIMAHSPDIISDISLETWLNIIVEKRPDKGIKLDFKSLEVVEPSLIILQKYASKLNGSVWLSADVLPGPVLPKAVPVRSDYFLAMSSRFFPGATLSLGWTTHWIKRFPINTWQYEWKHVRQMADTIRCWYNNKNYPTITFSVRGIYASRSIKQLQWLIDTIPSSSILVWTAPGDNVNSEDFLRIQESFPVEKVYFDVPYTLFMPSSKLKASNVPKKKYYKNYNKWVSVTRTQDKTCEEFTYTDNNFILFGRPSNSAVLQKTLIPVDRNSNFTATGRLKFFAGEQTLNPSHWEHRLKLVLSNVNNLPKYAMSYSKKKHNFNVRNPDILWSAVNSSVLYTFEHQYFQDNTACRMFKLGINSNLTFDAWTIPCDGTFDDKSYEEVSKSSIPEISLEENFEEENGMFMIGFHSYGDEYVLIYDLNVSKDFKYDDYNIDPPQIKLSLTSSSATLNENFISILSVLSVVINLCTYLTLRVS